MFHQISIQEISSIAIWIPLLLAFMSLQTGERKLRLFFVFLLFGALVDGFGFVVYTFFELDYLEIAHGFCMWIYLWFESLFFIWLAFEFLPSTIKKSWRNSLWIFFSISFSIDGFLRFVLDNPQDRFTSLIYSGFLIVTSFLMAFALLKMAERNGEIMNEPWFWILSGIFFYSFSCFFIDLLSFTELASSLWKLRVTVNIIQYGFFVVGLLKLPSRESTEI